ncbi:hypothetical protein [Fredinandcohnia quinoae]|uniref:Uncharacterized protein n=1 Tax=Fredinandcohnia quinoae TaxID=2918902 RepID=A0AAW5ECP3_9BACI|nr:hypothetical protein [Fredinandcohnia sp. SECRCQ15]MCH1627221.1 hypothetical protein [Fredinandcohnia sp. SECRCQ15]
MNVVIERSQRKYRNARESACYSIFDIESLLKTFAKEGLLWCLQDMFDLTEAEKILIGHYLLKHRELQVYDNAS